MRCYLPAIVFFVCTFCAFSQNAAKQMQVGGNVQDTVAKKPLTNAVAIAVRLSDSVLVKHTRTDKEGVFQLKNLPLDTYQVVISHPQFADQVFIVIGSEKNLVYDFGKIIMPLKTQQLSEIVVYAFKDPIYYRGDTLIYTADSFKVKPNATVEDLLKKLPGIKVDAAGKITTQGKTVDQVLVDGDEFFGSDPTVATRNLNANAIESVQVYDKKTENSSTTTSDNETIKVMNLKLKEDAKKGYFGKISGAGGGPDFKMQQQFYEGEILANKFSKKQKIAAFLLAGNTPKTNLGFGDIFKFGLMGDMNNMASNDEGNFYFSRPSDPVGIPVTFKTGAYFTDKIGKKTKLLFNYTYKSSQLTTQSTTRKQYFLEDTTYSTSNESYNTQAGESHTVNFEINQELDSLTTLTIKPKITIGKSSSGHLETNLFVTETDTVTRRTVIDNSSKGESIDFVNKLKLKRNFKKQDRVLKIDYDFDHSTSSGSGLLKTINTYSTAVSSPIADVDQKKTNSTLNYGHDVSASYTEPLNKKFKLEFMLDFITSKGNQDKAALNYANGDYTQKDSLVSNNFENTRTTYRGGFKFIYDVKKQRFAVGTRVRDVLVDNQDLVTGQSIHQDVTNVLPFLSWRYKFSDNRSYSFNYYTSSSLPSITQLQPVNNNANPNNISIGNPGLLPSYNHRFEMNFNSFKPITGNNFWSGFNADFTNNDFSDSTVYDNLGRTLTKPVNVNGNYSMSGWLGISKPFFSKVLEIDPNINASYSSNTNYINDQQNITTTASFAGDIEVQVEYEEFTLNVFGNYEYNVPKSTLNPVSSKPYVSQSYRAEITWELPGGIQLETDADYIINSKRSQGYNINYLIWNASLGKAFGKNENFWVYAKGNDILNQNTNTGRTVQGNVITDNKTNIIQRYLMLQLVWKFNSQKQKKEEDEFD